MFPVPDAANPILGISLVQVYVVLPPVFVVVKLIAVNVPPLHTVLFVTVLTLAEGLTSIVKVVDVPAQLVVLAKVGVTVIVAVKGAVPLFIAVNEGKLPVPDAANPIEVVLFVQL